MEDARVSRRQRLGDVALWFALVFLATMLGASVYQRISLIPEWGGALPQSVVTYFHGTGAGASIDRFWRSVIPPTGVLVIIAILANRAALARRTWLGAAGILFFAMLIWTFVYFVPQGVIPLMVRGGEGMSPEAITRTARAWIFWDWFRMAGTLASYLCLLKAATIPFYSLPGKAGAETA
jgi:hypothetical protein